MNSSDRGYTWLDRRLWAGSDPSLYRFAPHVTGWSGAKRYYAASYPLCLYPMIQSWSWGYFDMIPVTARDNHQPQPALHCLPQYTPRIEIPAASLSLSMTTGGCPCSDGRSIVQLRRVTRALTMTTDEISLHWPTDHFLSFSIKPMEACCLTE